MSGKFWDKAWSLVDGCTPVSAGCDNCWLAAMEHRFSGAVNQQYPAGRYLTNTAGKFIGKVTFRADRLDIPLRTRKPTVFAVWSDLYHEAVTDDQIASALGVMRLNPQHTYLIVTKRPERAKDCMRNRSKYKFRNYISRDFDEIVAENYQHVYHLVTVENQEMADERIPHALKIPGKVGLLIEPMLSEIDFTNIGIVIETGMEPDYLGFQDFHCVILGGETGPHARPMDTEWARSVRDQCHMAGVPFYLKHIDKKQGRLLDGREHNELPWRVNDGR